MTCRGPWRAAATGKGGSWPVEWPRPIHSIHSHAHACIHASKHAEIGLWQSTGEWQRPGAAVVKAAQGPAKRSS